MFGTRYRVPQSLVPYNGIHPSSKCAIVMSHRLLIHTVRCVRKHSSRTFTMEPDHDWNPVEPCRWNTVPRKTAEHCPEHCSNTAPRQHCTTPTALPAVSSQSHVATCHKCIANVTSDTQSRLPIAHATGTPPSSHRHVTTLLYGVSLVFFQRLHAIYCQVGELTTLCDVLRPP